LAGLTVSDAASAQDGNSTAKKKPPPAAIYDPYPPGILPDDLVAEIERVRREVNGIFEEALGQWRALPPPVLSNTQGTGNPPTLQGTGYEAVQILGKLLLFDENMSPFRNVACNFCHMPYAAFSGPIPSVNLTMIAYPGTLHFRANKRTAQRYTYSPKFTVLQYNEVQGLFFGANFWDARSTGYLLQNPDAEQAQHPPVDTGEMGFPDTACIAFRLSQAVYRPLFELIWGKGSFDIKFPKDTEKICSTPGGTPPFTTATPIRLSPADRTKADNVYDHWGQSISFYEHSPAVSAFTSKFDAFLAGTYTLTADEQAGYDLFRGKGNCNSCHLDGVSTTPNPNADWVKLAPSVDGQQQTLTARNVAMTPPQCPTTEAGQTDKNGKPVPYFQKEFFHNGYAKSLKQLVHFYNTRDVFAEDVTSGHCPEGTTEKVNCWPRPEVPNSNTLDMTVGNLGLTDAEEDLLVTFMQTLTDGFTTPFPDHDTFTGKCMTGGSAATQGNEFLIPTPDPLPPCAPAICGVAPVPGPHPIP
jgi:cytochrome c peroxidase